MINSPLENNLIEEIIEQYKNREDITFHFLIEEEEEYWIIDNWISKYELGCYKIIPYYNGKNYKLFSDNVFMEKKDLFSSPRIQRKIFCNQKLNSNNFGKLYILPEGNVKANLNKPDVGSVHKDLLLQIIYEELTKNTAWRDVRDSSPCTECLYQYLCPPPSNYELALGKPNLCHVTNVPTNCCEPPRKEYQSLCAHRSYRGADNNEGGDNSIIYV